MIAMVDTPQITLTKSGPDLMATDATGHSVRVPLSLDGLRLLAALLDGKAATPNAPLGSPFRPTQQMVNEFLKNRQRQAELQLELAKIEQTENLLKDF